MVAIHSTLARDLYVVFEGRNPDTGKPIVRIILNPLVNWIWIGVGIIIFGTLIALMPSLQPAARRVEATAPEPGNSVRGLSPVGHSASPSATPQSRRPAMR